MYKLPIGWGVSVLVVRSLKCLIDIYMFVTFLRVILFFKNEKHAKK